MAIYTTQLAYLHRVEFPESSSNAALEKWWGGIFTSGLVAFLTPFRLFTGGLQAIGVVL